jgi:hypothetical protein
MNARESARKAMFIRVGAFGKANAADFAPGSKAAENFTALAATVVALTKAEVGQQGGGATAKSVLLDALRLDLRNIARTATAIAQDAPGFDDDFTPPGSTGEAALTTTATAYLAALAKPAVLAAFAGHELPTTFVQDLVDDLAAIAEARDDQEAEREDAVGNTVSVGRLIAEGMKQVNYLNAAMHNKYTRRPEKLREWESASHIERALVREKPASPTTPPAPGTPTPPPTAT